MNTTRRKTKAGQMPVSREEVFTRALRAYRKHSTSFLETPQEVDAQASEVDLARGLVVLRSAEGKYRGLCRWSGKRIELLSTCIDCMEPIREWYMVTDTAWEKRAGFRGDECACLPCLGRRLGRELRLRDFTKAPINEYIRFVFKAARRSTLPASALAELIRG